MIDSDLKLKLQAYADGELSPRDRAAIQGLIARDAEAQRWLADLQSFRRVLRDHEPVLALPESRTFYWSKIARAIHSDNGRAAAPAASFPWSSVLRRWWAAPVAGAGVLAAVLFLSPHPTESAAALDEVETITPEMGTFTFRDHSAGVTLVWVYDRTESQFTEGPRRDTLNPQ